MFKFWCHINLYYKNIESNDWIEFNEPIKPYDTSFKWNTQEVDDGFYIIYISVTDYTGDISQDTSGTIIDNGSDQSLTINLESIAFT